MARTGRNVRVSGRVQGVFFRAWTAEQARSLGVAGWVRNCPDGSVEAHLAGEQDAVERLIERLGHGPRDARVSEVRVEEAEPESGPEFSIRR